MVLNVRPPHQTLSSMHRVFYILKVIRSQLESGNLRGLLMSFLGSFWGPLPSGLLLYHEGVYFV